MKRNAGLGTVTEMPDGRFRARGPRQSDGTRPSLGIYPTREDAERALTVDLHRLKGAKRVVGQTFEEFGLDILDERELNGVRGIAHERHRFAKHISSAPFAQKQPDQIKSTDVAEWLRIMNRKRADDRRGDRPLSRQTIARCLSLVSVIFDEAGPQERGIVPVNPCLGLRVKKRSDEKATEDPWTFLTLDEQLKIRSSDLPPDERLIVLFSLGCGLRQGEQFNLELRDLHVTGDEPRVVVRFGSRGKPPKNGKIRTVPLFGLALEAAREWLDILPAYCPHNFDRLVFPTRNGHRRGQKPLGNGRFVLAEDGTHVMRSGKPVRQAHGTHVYVDRFELAMRAVGIERNVRWHDLRHTCASSLVGGFWGDAWTLEEVRDMMGHSSITVTQRSAHLGQTALKKASRKIRFDVGPAGVEPATPGLKGPCATIAPRSPVGHDWPTRVAN
jgi:integrase